MTTHETPSGAGTAGPILAPSGASPALASGPDVLLEDGRFHIYEANPVPWWMAVLWVGFFIFAVTYLIVSLLE